MQVKHESGIFYIGSDRNNYQAKATYHFQSDDVLVVDHIITRREFRGRGLAREVLSGLIDWARTEGVKIVPECSFASQVMHESDTYRDMIYSKS